MSGLDNYYDALSETVPEIINFISIIKQRQNFNYFSDIYNHLLNPEIRPILLEALYFPEIRELILAKKLSFDEIVSMFKHDRKSFLAALSDDNLRKRICDVEDPTFKPSNTYKSEGRDDAILNIGKKLSDSQILPLVILKYLTVDEIIERRLWSADALNSFAKYRLLLNLQKFVHQPNLKSFGFLGIYFPAVIQSLQAQLERLKSIVSISNIHSEKQMIVVDKTIQNIFTNVFETLKKWIT